MFDEPLISSKQLFSVELISNLLFEIKNGKAVGLDDLSCEHLKYSDPIVSILCKLINFFVANGHVPDSFGRSYMVPIPKSNVRNRALTADDFRFRGIAIRPVMSKFLNMPFYVILQTIFVLPTTSLVLTNVLVVVMLYTMCEIL